MANYSLRDNPLTEDLAFLSESLRECYAFSRKYLSNCIPYEASFRRKLGKHRVSDATNTMTRTDMLAAINAYAEEIAFITEEGNIASLREANEFFWRKTRAMYRQRGIFLQIDFASFRRKLVKFAARRTTHTLKVNAQAGTALKEAATKIKLTKVQGASAIPWITGVRDTLSAADDTTNALKAGSVIELTGSRLKFDAADTEQGVFFIKDGAETRCAQVVENKPSRVLAVLPATLAAGEYTVEVRTRNNTNGNPTKAVKKGAFERLVTVTA